MKKQRTRRLLWKDEQVLDSSIQKYCKSYLLRLARWRVSLKLRHRLPSKGQTLPGTPVSSTQSSPSQLTTPLRQSRIARSFISPQLILSSDRQHAPYRSRCCFKATRSLLPPSRLTFLSVYFRTSTGLGCNHHRTSCNLLNATDLTSTAYPSFTCRLSD